MCEKLNHGKERSMEENASVLGQQLYGLDRDTLAALGAALCAQLTEYGSYHGGVRPENIGFDGADRVTLGAPANRETTGDWSPAELEYMAPEVFWNGTRTSAADVYSVGMLLYAGVTGGQMPFCPANATAADRDEALRLRMNGEMPEMPKTAGKHLARIIEKAIQFRADDRYENPAALGAALTKYRDHLHLLPVPHQSQMVRADLRFVGTRLRCFGYCRWCGALRALRRHGLRSHPHSALAQTRTSKQSTELLQLQRQP